MLLISRDLSNRKFPHPEVIVVIYIMTHCLVKNGLKSEPCWTECCCVEHHPCSKEYPFVVSHMGTPIGEGRVFSLCKMGREQLGQITQEVWGKYSF